METELILIALLWVGLIVLVIWSNYMMLTYSRDLVNRNREVMQENDKLSKDNDRLRADFQDLALQFHTTLAENAMLTAKVESADYKDGDA